MAYIGNSPGTASQRIVTVFTATAGQTTFTPTSGYALGYCDVFMNGVKLINGDDYTAADGINVVLISGAAVNDTVEIVAFIPLGLMDGYTKAEVNSLLSGLDTDANSTTKGMYEMSNTISSNATIDNGNNAISAGPITVNSCVTVTVPTGSRWVVV